MHPPPILTDHELEQQLERRDAATLRCCRGLAWLSAAFHDRLLQHAARLARRHRQLHQLLGAAPPQADTPQMAPAAPASSPPARVVLAAAALLMARSGSASGCSFCAGNKTFDLSSVPTEVFTLHSGTRGSLTDPWLTYYVTSPCGSVGSAPDDMCFGGSTSDPAAQHYTGTTPDGRYGAADPSPPHPPRPAAAQRGHLLPGTASRLSAAGWVPLASSPRWTTSAASLRSRCAVGRRNGATAPPA